MKKYLGGVLAFVPCLVALVVYANTLHHGFVYDDEYFTDFPEFHSASGVLKSFKSPYNPSVSDVGLYRPIPMATFSLTYVLGGDSPFLFHLGNIILFGLSCSLLYVFLRKSLLLENYLSLGIACLFAVLPIHTEVVANIKSRDEILAFIFLLLMWITFRKRKTFFILGSSVFFLLGLLSKETAITFPVIILGFEIINDYKKWKELLSPLFLYSVTTVLYLIIRFWAVGIDLETRYAYPYIHNPLFYISVWQRIFSVLKIISIYLSTILVPFHLSATYHYAYFSPVNNIINDLLWIPGLLFIFFLGIVSYMFKNKPASILMGVLIFVVSYLPYSQIFPITDVMAERWMFIPSLGILLLFVSMIGKIFHSRRSLQILIIVVICTIYGLVTIQRNPVWASNLSLFTSMVVDAPQSARGHLLLAKEYVKSKKFSEANEEVEKATSIYSEDLRLYNLKALIYLAQAKNQEARTALLLSDKLNPNDLEKERLWATYFYQTNNYLEALKHSSKLIGNNQIGRFEDIFTHAVILSKLKKYDESLNILSQVASADRKRWQVSYLNAVILYKRGKIQEALQISWDSKLSLKEKQYMLESF